MLKIEILCIGKIKEQFFKDAISEYSKRLSKYCNLTITELPDEKIPNKINDSIEYSIKNKESQSLLSHIKKDSYVVCLDLKGKQLSSQQFSQKIADISLHTSSSITFIIGGSLGMTEELLKSSDYNICFSSMTFPHQLIRIFLLEQIYRAFKILNNETYHR